MVEPALQTALAQQALAQRVVESASEIEMLAASLRNPLTGTFRLGAIPTVSPFIFPKLVSGVRARLPDIRLVLHEDITSELIDKLEKGRVDAIIAALPLEGDLLRSRHVFDDPFLLSVPPEHHLAFATEVDRAELSGLNPLLLSEGHCLRDQALEICGVASDEDEPDLRATSIETLRQMVKAGSGVTLMPQIAIKPNEPGISYVPISPSPKRSIGLLWRKTTSRSAVNEIIADLTIEVARAHRPFEE